MELIQDFLPLPITQFINDKLTSPFVEWYYNHESVFTKTTDQTLFVIDSNTIKTPQFFHPIFGFGGRPYKEDQTVNDQELFAMCSTILNLAGAALGFEIESLYRIKANILSRDSRFKTNNYGIPHVDTNDINVDSKLKSLVFYVNDSDGDTFIFNEIVSKLANPTLSINSRSTPKQGKAIYFNSDQFHAASNPTTVDSRIVINFTFKIK